jgi:hypothetical protein
MEVISSSASLQKHDADNAAAAAEDDDDDDDDANNLSCLSTGSLVQIENFCLAKSSDDEDLSRVFLVDMGGCWGWVSEAAGWHGITDVQPGCHTHVQRTCMTPMMMGGCFGLLR